MTIVRTSPEKPQTRRQKLAALLSSQDNDHDDFTTHQNYSRRNSDSSAPTTSAAGNTPMYQYYSNPNTATSSPYNPMSPWSQPSPYTKSPWIHQLIGSSLPTDDEFDPNGNGLIGSLYREEGHVCSLAVSGGILYTGSDSKNVRVWKNLEEFSGFKSSSGFVKAIVLFENKVFTGHQDGKIRVWKYLDYKRSKYKRIGNLPTTRDLLIKSVNPKSYVEVRRNHNVPWVKHYDAVSCLSIDQNQGLLYSGSWDRTLKVWRISDSKCLESIHAHDDALNSVVVAFDGLVFTGSADGSVKAWRRELVGKSTQHVLVETMLKQDHALTSLAVSHEAGALYAGSSDGLISFWDREKHFMCYGGVLRGHKLAVLCLAVGGKLVLSGSADKSICVWRRDVGGVHSCVAVLTGHAGPVKCLAVEEREEEEEEESDDDKQWTVYSGCLDKAVKVWRVSESALGLGDIEEEE